MSTITMLDTIPRGSIESENVAILLREKHIAYEYLTKDSLLAY